MNNVYLVILLIPAGYRREHVKQLINLLLRNMQFQAAAPIQAGLFIFCLEGGGEAHLFLMVGGIYVYLLTKKFKVEKKGIF